MREPTEMELRVAKAIATVSLVGVVWAELDENSRWEIIWQACAAIRAMREPTEDMIEASFGAGTASVYDAWKSMIDAASPTDET